MLSGTSETLLNVISSTIPNYISYNKNGTYLDLNFGDIDINEEVGQIIGVNLLDKIDRYSDERITPLSITGREYNPTNQLETSLAKTRSDSVDIVTMFYGLHHLSDDYLSVMNSLARVTKSGALMIITGLNIDNHEAADGVEFNYFVTSAISGESYTDALRKSKRSYTAIEETIESFTTFGFYLLLIVNEVDVENGYMAVFRKSSAPDRSYIPVYTHPVYSIQSGNIHEMLGLIEDDEVVYESYKREMGLLT